MGIYIDQCGNLFSQDDLENLTGWETKNLRFREYVVGDFS
jgi:hypothetical protein